MDFNAINASKLSRFQAEIDKLADSEIAELSSKVQQQSGQAEQLHIKYEIHKEAAKIRAERNAAETRIKKELSRCESDAERKVLSHRKSLIDGFFSELGEELRRFADSDRYEGYLRNALSKAEKELGKGFTVLAAERDVQKLKQLTENEVRADNSIAIGGICAMNEQKGLFVDYSLDMRLSQEREGFVSKRELML